MLLAGPVSGTFSSLKISGHIASKVFEYLGSRRPVLYIGEAGSEVETLIRQFRGVAFVRPYDTHGVEEIILSLIRQGPTVERDGLEPYTRRALTGRLAKILTDACSGQPIASLHDATSTR
jgi:hypothetical protein